MTLPDAAGGLRGAGNALVEQSAFGAPLPNRITLPSFDVDDGMEVVCSEQSRKDFLLDDAVVFVFVDVRKLDESK